MEYTVSSNNIQATTEDNTLYITSIINSGLKDTINDKLTEKAMESIIKQATTHNLHMEHDKTFNGVLGPIIEAKKVPQGIQIKSKVRPDKEKLIKPLLEFGVNVGSSISGQPIRNVNNPNIIEDWQLVEVSLTPIPADQSTMGKTWISKSVKGIIDKAMSDLNNGDENMADNDFLTKEDGINLINEAFNEKQESMVEDIVGRVTTTNDEKYMEVMEEIANLNSKIEEIAKQLPNKEENTEQKENTNSENSKNTENTEEKPENNKVNNFGSSLDKQINLEELVNKSATQGALTVLSEIFGNTRHNLNVKYDDKQYSFEKQLNGVKNRENQNGIEDKELSARKIAELI